MEKEAPKATSVVEFAETLIRAFDQAITNPLEKAVSEFTPKFFECVGWLAALAALHFVFTKTQSLAVFTLMGVGYFALFFYFNFLFIRVFKRLLSRQRLLVQSLLSGALASGTLFLASRLVGTATSAMTAST